ncbi:MAG: hypothetical protein K9G67_14650 [Bacteroidales bacterium]|nr:hypothetical protein [Bacteroidales bacterium]MCF8377592.1 hypothetical protein [Bacteroidales bacterium]MCF8401827.1 hypothetical protein [Bacteroidales bacterium]
MIFGDLEYTHNHGTSTGIIPRFYLQMLELASLTFETKKEKDRLFSNFEKNNIPDFTEFYDIYHELINKYDQYGKGLIDGTYLKIQDNGTFHLDRGLEIEMRKLIKSFFVVGRRLLNNFVQSEMIRNEKIDLRKLVIVKDGNFDKNREAYINSNHSGISYELLYQIIHDARNEFLANFNEQRGKIEHSSFEMPKFEVKRNKGQLIIQEPSLNGNIRLIEEISRFYILLLDFIENLMVYYYGLNAYERTNGNLTLFYRKDYDFPSLRYKYVIQIRINDPSLTLLIN